MFKNVYNANEMYSVMMSLLKNGVETSPRDQKVKEVTGVSFRINNPRDRVITEVNRKFPVKGALAEFLWYMTQNPNIEYITPYLPHWKNYSDDGVKVNSNYGFRWGEQIPAVIEKIKKDRDTRQAVVTLYDPGFATYYGKDNVCTPDFQFLLRDNLLHLIVNARSRDAIRGECIDQFTFSYLQELVANSLGVNVGFYQVNIGSLHIYEQHFNLFDSPMTFNEDMKKDLISVDKTNLGYIQFWGDLLQYIKVEEKVESDSLLTLIKKKEIDYEKFFDGRCAILPSDTRDSVLKGIRESENLQED